ncbi:MAG: glycosyltransferase [Acidimicrobiales bacterium]
MKQSASPSDGVESLAEQDLLETAIHGNDWRGLNPPKIGEGKFVDRVTVILPCYMGQRELSLTFAGLSRQTYPHHLIEVIVVDDGSDPPIKLPSQLPFDTSVVVQERDGFGLARARNLGAKDAKGEILIFLDCDMIPEPQLVEAHSRWHHENEFGLTLGFRSHTDFSGISQEDLIKADEIENLVYGRKVTTPQWIEFHMGRTKNLTSNDSDLFRIATGGNLGIRKAFFDTVGGFDSTFRQWGGEDIEFGFRAFNLGAVLIPERLAKAWHQGEGASPDPEEEASLEQQRNRLSHLIAEKTFRDSSPGRSFEIPMLAVVIDADQQNLNEIASQVNSVLSSTFHDLVVFVETSESHPDRINLERQYGPDPRVVVKADVFEQMSSSSFQLEMPPEFCFNAGDIHYLMNSVEKYGLLKVDLGIQGEIRLARTRALKRSEQIGLADFWTGAGQFFGEKLLTAEKLGIYKKSGKTEAPQGSSLNPPVWLLASKVFKKIFGIRSFSDARSVSIWLFRGVLNVIRRIKLTDKVKNFEIRKTALHSPNWIRIVGDNSYFPHVRPWRGNSSGVEVVLVSPDKKNWDSSLIRSVFLGEKTGIPLAPPFNAKVFNPAGFKEVKAGSQIVEAPEFKRSGDFIRQARSALAVEIERIDSSESAQKVLELSAIGVPVILKENTQTQAWLGKQMTELLNGIDKEKLKDPTIREKVSVELRRAALKEHSYEKRIQKIREHAGLSIFREPSVSVIVASNRPEMTKRIFNTVKEQDHKNLELIFALHGDGFEDSYPEFSKSDLPVTVLRYPKETIFGRILSEASSVATGDWIAKMDDDDWYGKEHVSDLLLAASYSDADLVGKGSEFVYLEEENLTIRRDLGNSEVESRTIGGGAMLVKAETYREISGWRELSRGVDVALIDDVVSNGGRVWRTHPFGYLLRRTKNRHTWKVDDKYFLRHADQQWEGFDSELVSVLDK